MYVNNTGFHHDIHMTELKTELFTTINQTTPAQTGLFNKPACFYRNINEVNDNM